ncbi:MAG: hypothetical protein HFJ60_01980 [Clostridia bacterium]|nr:hypothetical protein [Clostridia bacterium]
MPRRKKEVIDGISDKLEYLGLDLEKIPADLKRFEPLQYKIPRFYDEKKYRQYRYVDIKDIQILLSPTNRLEDLSEKYKKASPLYEYLDKDNEKNILKYTTFLNMLKNVNIQEIENVEKEQERLNENIPFKVKFNGNYLWQIYYSENTNKYFMIVPTEDTDYSTFFYLLKKKIEGKNEKIFVPISSVKYSNKYLKNSEFEDIQNYLWLFTKDWPLIYEVYDKNEEISIQIIGETNVYERIRTLYKVKLSKKERANNFYKLLKALFILQTELPNFYNFETNINEKGSLEFYLEGQKIEYKNIVEFIREQYKKGLKRRKELKSKIRAYKKKLKQLQELAATQEIEYLAKEKQISTFLECKKSFFGKFKYYFKYSKKNNRKNDVIENEKDVENEIQIEKKSEVKKEKKKIPIKKVYTLDELITSYKELEELENNIKNLLMDINALKLKTKNTAKKIENATKFIEEIDSHKKSIFEFWKYSNKDEMATLPEGEQEEINIIKKIEKVFDYNEDFEKFGEKLDKIQRKILTKDEANSVYIATTQLIKVLNEIKNNDITPESLEKNLKKLKSEAIELKSLDEEEYDIFGNIIEDNTKVKKINNKSHRELPRDKFEILDIDKNTKTIGYKLTLQVVIKNILKALDSVVIPESLAVYRMTDSEKLNIKEINVFNINPENEIKEVLKSDFYKINLYKLNIKEGTNGVGFTNIIFYDNKNKTLPIGMDLSTKMIVDISKLHLSLVNEKSFKIANFENEENDFSKISIKDVQVFEYEVVDLENIDDE